jgi:protein-disulfide isomerase
MTEHLQFRNIIKNNICMSIITTVTIATTISFSYLILSLLFSSLLSYTRFSNYDLFSMEAFAQAQAQSRGENSALSLFNLIKQDSPYQGSTSAPVILIDFSDLQCKLCQRFVKSTEPQINSTYIQTGKVIMVFKHLPNRGFDSFPASLAAQCTNDQGKFWQFHNFLYNIQGPIDSGWAGKDNLEKLALQVPGLDIQKFMSCFENQKYKSKIDVDIALAHSLGYTQTPSFVIVKSDGSNPQKLEGPQPFPEFKAVIDRELGGA